MNIASSHLKFKELSQILSLRRVLLTLLMANLVGLLMSLGWLSSTMGLLLRTSIIGLGAMVIFGVLEFWPKRLPKWLARWVLQVIGVAAIIPIITYGIYSLSTEVGALPFWQDPDRMEGFKALTILGLLVSPWVALAALVRQKDALARHQALAFKLERSELERQALEARHRLMQAQVSPHFLFNTLANIQALVDVRSPRAADVLRTLVDYLRAAVPRLNERDTTIKDECQLARSYLELMHLRMPDRLSFSFDIDDQTQGLRCPPMTLMTLVENAVRHGIDPTEEGGKIDIAIQKSGKRCRIRVSDTGVGLGQNDSEQRAQQSAGLGTGLFSLRERLKLNFGDEVNLQLLEQTPHGACAEIEFPAQDITVKPANKR